MNNFRNCLWQFFYNFEKIKKSGTDLRERDDKDNIIKDPYLDDFEQCLKDLNILENDRNSIILLSQCWIDDQLKTINQWKNYNDNPNNVFFDEAEKTQKNKNKECAESVYSFLKMGFVDLSNKRREQRKTLIENCEKIIDTKDDTMKKLTPNIQIINKKSLLLLPPNFIGLILISSLLLMIIFYIFAGKHIGDIITGRIFNLINDICNILQCK